MCVYIVPDLVTKVHVPLFTSPVSEAAYALFQRGRRPPRPRGTRRRRHTVTEKPKSNKVERRVGEIPLYLYRQSRARVSRGVNATHEVKPESRTGARGQLAADEPSMTTAITA